MSKITWNLFLEILIQELILLKIVAQSLNFFVYIDNVKAIAPLRVRVTILFVSRKTEIILTLIF